MATLDPAQDADGNLRDASEITWFHDVDDVNPLPNPSIPATSETPPAKITEYFATKPVEKTAGSRRPVRATRLSLKAKDPDNAVTFSGSLKRKSSPKPTEPRRRARKVVILSDDEDEAATTDVGSENIPSLIDDEESNAEDSIDPEIGYQHSKNLREQDDAVCFLV